MDLSDFTKQQTLELESKIKELLVGFRASVPYSRLREEAKRYVDGILTFFVAQMYLVHSEMPESWTDESLDDVLTDVFVRRLYDKRIVTEFGFYRGVKPVLTACLEYLHAEQVVTSEQQEQLLYALSASATEMRFIVEQRRRNEDPDWGYDDDYDDDAGPLLSVGARVLNTLEDDLDLETGGTDLDAGDMDLLNQLRIELNRLINRAGTPRREVLIKRTKEAVDATPPDLSQWKELYRWGEEIYALAPWRFLDIDEFCIVEVPGEPEPIFCSIYGHDESPGFVVYRGYKALDAAFMQCDPELEAPAALEMGFEDGLFCHFVHKLRLEKTDRDVLSALGLKYRGHRWVQFRRMHPGVYPWFITRDEAALLEKVLPQVAAVYEELAQKRYPVDFDKGETVVRRYDPVSCTWNSKVEQFPEVHPEYPPVPMDNIFVLRQLQHETFNDLDVELDFVFLPMPLDTGNTSPALMPRYGLVVDVETGRIMNQLLGGVEDEEDDAHFVMNLLANYVQQYGRPTTVYCRNHLVESYVADLCKKLSISVEVDLEAGLPEMDEVLQGLMDAMS
jgi:hypothetical protein